MRYFLALVTIFCFACLAELHAQVIPTSPNCPPTQNLGGVVIFGPDTSGCALPVTLNAAAFNIVGTTDSYTVSNVPYTPYPWAGTTQITSISAVDDIWSDSIPLPFDFCFFGQRFTKFVASSNGSLSFNVAQATGGNTWSTAAWGPMPVPTGTSGGDFDYVICGPHHDIDPGAGTAGPQTQVTYATYGTAPCRAFVVSWDSIPLFSCTSLFATQAIVLYESTNIIDIIIKEKTLCSTWNNGIAYQGIQDNGTKAFTVPGRNGTVWTDSNSQWRFTPSGNAAGGTSFTWIDLSTGNIIGTGPSVTVVPLQTTSYACIATICPNTVIGIDTHTVAIVDPVIASFVPTVKLGCEDDTIYFDNTSQNAQTYLWSFGDGGVSIADEPISHIYTTQNIYTVSLIVTNAGCADTAIQVFDLRHPINAEFVVDTTICLNPAAGQNGNIAVGNFSTGGGIVTTFDFGDGTTVVHTNTSVVPTHNYTQPGLYTITVSVMDTLGCVDTMRRNVYVEGIPFAFASCNDSSVCVGEVVSFNDSITELAASWQWVFPGGFTLTEVHDPIYSFVDAGQQNVTLNVEFLYCPDLTVTLPISVGNIPAVDLGPDTSYCDGYSIPINLPINGAGGVSPGSTVTWNTGTVSPSIAVTTPGTYYAIAESNGGCLGSDTIVVRNDCYLNIPNAFSPGQDGLNETFLPTGQLMAGATAYELNIYNRWGELVFATKNLNSRGWDGKFGNKPQPMGVYVYNVKVTFKNGKSYTYTGNVTLVR
ncbi:MAG: hypothetical protein RL660_1562 [Bacteroidota bacterium]|jgi:gliding motility-associated-like protein